MPSLVLCDLIIPFSSGNYYSWLEQLYPYHKSKEIYQKLKPMRTHGVPDTQKDYPYNHLGFNFRYNDLLASIGLVQLSKVKKHIEHVKLIYKKYENVIEQLPFLKLIPVNVPEGEIPLWVEVLCEERQKLMDFLSSHNIDTRYFLPDLHLSPHLKNEKNFSGISVFGRQGLFLPCGPNQSLDKVDRVIDILKRYEYNK